MQLANPCSDRRIQNQQPGSPAMQLANPCSDRQIQNQQPGLLFCRLRPRMSAIAWPRTCERHSLRRAVHVSGPRLWHLRSSRNLWTRTSIFFTASFRAESADLCALRQPSSFGQLSTKRTG
eukprot:65871-Alexandrium_andersonii.AAC.1